MTLANDPRFLPETSYTEAAVYLKSQLPASLAHPQVGIVCGSGLGGLGALLTGDVVEIPYNTIPGFVNSTVAGHAGKLVFGLLAGVPTICMQGRYHFYEGHTLQQTTLPLRVMKLLGIHTIILTNAVGALNPEFNVGDVVAVADHIALPGLAGNNPLIGPNLELFGTRFPATSDAYDLELRKLVFRTVRQTPALSQPSAGKEPLRVHEGIYAFVAGPSYETRAEGRALRSLGADIVGMSTIPEVIISRHSGLRVLTLSLVTNVVVTNRERSAKDLEDEEWRKENGLEVAEQAIVEEPPAATHAEVLAASAVRAKDMELLVTELVKRIAN
ncbi:hypothetical protein GQ42DRAFT_161186 [Ramicandelaber brevisporus]|nr:hypothetical protein GQ42DRAFT_161186 [Ramicandelaber brevisporus]